MKLQDYFKSDVLAIDTETTGLSWLKDKLVVVSVSDGKNFDAYMWKDISIADTKKLTLYLQDSKKIKVMHNAKFDCGFFTTVGMYKIVNVWDTINMAKIVNENLPNYKLKDLATRFIDAKAKTSQQALEKYMNDNKFSFADIEKVPAKILLPYAAYDALFTYKLYEKFLPEVKKNFSQLWDVEVNLLPVILSMERHGVLLSTRHLAVQKKLFNASLNKLNPYLKKKLGNINFSSSKQIGNALIKLGVKLPINKLGNVLTNISTLHEIDHPIVEAIIHHRQLTKLIGTYCEGIPKLVNNKSILYCSFNQMGARTGRFSCAQPNLQNIPKDFRTTDSNIHIKTDFMKGITKNFGNIRGAFKVRKGFTNFYFDYQQMELRMLVHYTQDPLMLKVFNAGGDFHSETACKLYDKPLDKITADERTTAKHINFAIIYGSGIKGLEKKFKLTRDKASQLYYRYLNIYPSVNQFRKEAGRKIEERGYVFTYLGRRRRLEAKDSYKAANAIIQGSCADMVKVAMLRVHKLLKSTKSHILLQVHDELVAEMPKSDHFLVPEIKSTMEHFPDIKIATVVDVEYSTTDWSSKKKWRKK